MARHKPRGCYSGDTEWGYYTEPIITMPNKYNKIDDALIRGRKWGALLESLQPGGYIFTVPDAVAVVSLQVSVAQFNKENHKLRISINADKVNLGVALMVTKRNKNEH